MSARGPRRPLWCQPSRRQYGSYCHRPTHQSDLCRLCIQIGSGGRTKRASGADPAGAARRGRLVTMSRPGLRDGPPPPPARPARSGYSSSQAGVRGGAGEVFRPGPSRSFPAARIPLWPETRSLRRQWKKAEWSAQNRTCAHQARSCPKTLEHTSHSPTRDGTA